MRGSGVTVERVVPQMGSNQPVPSSNMFSPAWNSGCPTLQCSADKCCATLRIWCSTCVDKVNSGHEELKFPWKNLKKILNNSGWTVTSAKCEGINKGWLLCPRHTIRTPVGTPCFYPHLWEQQHYYPCSVCQAFFENYQKTWMAEQNVAQYPDVDAYAEI